MALTSKQRQYLKGLAHPLAPIVRVGRGRVTDSLITETKKSLLAHELIKVRIEIDDSAERSAIAEKLAAAAEAEIAGRVGDRGKLGSGLKSKVPRTMLRSSTMPSRHFRL